MSLSTSLIIPYRRPADLKRCLIAIQKQVLKPDEVIVICQLIDFDTVRLIDEFKCLMDNLIGVYVEEPGQVAALNAGLTASKGQVIAITDDDAAPHEHWLQTIVHHFMINPSVGGVGGRDWMYINGILCEGKEPLIGKVSWFGRAKGSHHLGTGDFRSVDILKGANMSYRREAILGLEFDTRLRGKGAQVDNDMAFSLQVKKRGWTLIYDPKVSIDHFLSDRFDEDQRFEFNRISQRNTAHNETLTLLEFLPIHRKIFYAIWALIIGTRRVPGLLQVIRFLPIQGVESIFKGITSFQGRCEGVIAWIQATKINPVRK
jgi:cellulose synthase/poly-beta-1,6-N-acetylglucosamine synthase-like glycosyltransferase